MIFFEYLSEIFLKIAANWCTIVQFGDGVGIFDIPDGGYDGVLWGLD